ncbi:M23 family metallopeptidase [Kistimonas scapharcae]|uniref:M23 family metallopeptidase n=1 Tax=Kistimonas scapharcae TaxID=1036133 RepID=A0ABP8V7W9_9GAMM
MTILNKCVFAAAIVLQALTASADGSKPLTQGALYKGTVQPGSEVYYRDKKVPVTAAGQFVLGFGRDAELQQSYTVVAPDGKKTQTALKLEAREYPVQRIEGVAQKYMAPSEAHLKRVRHENSLVRKAREVDSELHAFLDGFIWPLVGPVTGVYGSQRVFNGEPRRPHFGVDVAAPTGTPVKSPADGRVVLYHPDMYFSGGTMIIDHGYGITSSFLHLSKSLVKEGDFVRQGQAVAEVGATGRVTGAHLDWRLNWYQVRLDPQLVVPPMEQVQSAPAAK